MSDLVAPEPQRQPLSWNFHVLLYLKFEENGAICNMHPVSINPVAENVL